jgi:hypothetical protein
MGLGFFLVHSHIIKRSIFHASQVAAASCKCYRPLDGKTSLATKGLFFSIKSGGGAAAAGARRSHSNLPLVIFAFNGIFKGAY